MSAMNASSASDFAQRVFQLSSSFEPAVADVLRSDASRLEQFWFLAIASEKLFLESTAFQLGFGLCENRVVRHESSPISKLRKEAAIRSLPGPQRNQKFLVLPILVFAKSCSTLESREKRRKLL